MSGEDRSTPRQQFVDFFSSRAGAAVFSLGTVVAVTHGTPVDTAGVYIAAVSYAVLLFSFLDLGTGPNLVRTAVHGDQGTHIAVYVWTRATLTAIVLAVGAIGVLFLFPDDARAAGFISLGYVACSIYGVAGPVGQVVGSAKAFRVLTLLQGATVFALVLACVLFVSEPSAELLVAAYSVGALLATVLGLKWVSGHMGYVKLSELPRLVRGNLRSVLMLGVATGAGAIYLRIDQMLVIRYAGSASSAFYGVAARIALQARLLPSSLQLAVSALLAQRMQSDGGLREDERKLLSTIALAIGLGVSAIVVASSDAAVYLFGGSDYSEAVVPTIILGVSLVSTSYSYLVGTALIMAGRDRAYLIIMLAAVVANVTLNILLIPSLGIDAAAMIAAGTEVLAVIAIAEVIGPAGGASRRTTFLGVLAIAAAIGAAKYGLLEVSIWANAAVSAIIVGAGIWLIWRAYAGLRTLPSPSELDELSVLP